jgi:hypothetical protein
MADLTQLNIQAQDHSAPEYTLLPKGYYKIVALKEELKDSTKGGKYISIEFEAVESKRKIWENFNNVNDNATTVKIATEQLESFAWAVGLNTLRNSEELLFKEVTAYVDIEPEKNGYKAKNKIKGYYPVAWTVEQIEAHRKSKASKTGEGGGVPPVATPAAPVGAAASPWARK